MAISQMVIIFECSMDNHTRVPVVLHMMLLFDPMSSLSNTTPSFHFCSFYYSSD